MKAGQVSIYTSGGWPNAADGNLSDEQLMALTDEQLRPIVAENMEQVLGLTDGRMPYLADGDLGIWREWIRIMCGRILRKRLGLKPHTGWQYHYYFRRPRSGRNLKPSDIGDLGLVRRAKLGWSVFQEIRSKHEQPDLKFLVGVPSPFDLAIFTGMYLDDKAFLKATAQQIEEILQVIPAEEVVFSLELPVEQIAVAFAATVGLGDWAARRFAGEVRTLLNCLPENLRGRVRLALHPCWGDLNGESMIEVVLARYFGFLSENRRRKIARKLQSPSNVVRLVKAYLDEASDNIEVAQCPLGAGTQAPPVDVQSYVALRDLLLYRDRGVKFVAGWAHESLTDADVALVQQTVCEAVGPDLFTLAGPRCGLSRHAADAKRVLQQPLQETI